MRVLRQRQHPLPVVREDYRISPLDRLFEPGQHAPKRVAVERARKDFEQYVTSQEFDVKVTQLAGFNGPVNALVPDGKRCNLGFALCVDVPPNPTRHQRWWALVPSDQVGVVLHNMKDVLRARSVVFTLTQISGAFTSRLAGLDPNNLIT